MERKSKVEAVVSDEGTKEERQDKGINRANIKLKVVS